MDGRPVLVVKLGGSLITNKRARASLRAGALKRAASQLVLAHEVVSLVVVHGAGSFGHHEAKEHGLRHGGTVRACPRHVAVGEALTRAAVRTLNAHVCVALAHAGIPACAISPADCGTVTDGYGARVLESEGLDAAVRAALARGQVPVIHGDVVPDEASRASTAPRPVSILSGDVILHHLALTLAASAAVTVSDVPGLILPSTAGFTIDAPLIRVIAIEASPPAPVAATAATPPPTSGASSPAAAVAGSSACPAPAAPAAGPAAAAAAPHTARRCSALVELSDPCELCRLRLSVPPPGSGQPMAVEAQGDWGRRADVGADVGAGVGADVPDVTGGMHGKVWELCQLAGGAADEGCAVMLLGLGAEGSSAPLCRLAEQLSLGEAGGREGQEDAESAQFRLLGVGGALASRVAGVRGTLVARVR